MLNALVSTLLAMGILPAWVGFSPEVQKWGFSFQSIKWGAPVFLWFLWRERAALPRATLFAGLFLFVGTVTLGPAVTACPIIPFGFLREWGVWCTATLSALTYFTLPPSNRRAISAAWWGILVGAFLIDWLAPDFLNYIYIKFLDPATRHGDYEETRSVWVWSGIWGRQSFGKLLSWIPFLFVAERLAAPKLNWKDGILIVLALATTFLALGTSQRGPFFAVILGYIVMGIAMMFWVKSSVLKKWIQAGFASLVILFIMFLSFVPKSTWLPRLQSIPTALSVAIGWSDEESLSSDKTSAVGNIIYRIYALRLSKELIRDYPLGYPCVPVQMFRTHNLYTPGHAHHMFLHVLRDHGWLFGFLHLLIWVIGPWVVFRKNEITLSSFGWLGAWTSVMAGGLFDYPWFVTHQAVVLAIVFWAPYFKSDPISENRA